MTNYFEYNGKKYPRKEVYYPEDNEYYTVATEDLEKALLANGETYVSNEARRIDEQIFFFLPEYAFNFSEEQIAQFMKESME